MTSLAFRKPVTVLVGLGFPRRIANAQSALAYLDDLPMSLRDELYEAARDACRTALQGKGSVQLACKAVASFAAGRGVLVEEPLATAAMSAKEDLLGV